MVLQYLPWIIGQYLCPSRRLTLNLSWLSSNKHENNGRRHPQRHFTKPTLTQSHNNPNHYNHRILVLLPSTQHHWLNLLLRKVRMSKTHVHTYMSAWMHIYSIDREQVHTYVSTYLYLPIYLPIYLSVYPSIHSSIHPSIYPSTSPSIYPSIHLSI